MLSCPARFRPLVSVWIPVRWTVVSPITLLHLCFRHDVGASLSRYLLPKGGEIVLPRLSAVIPDRIDPGAMESDQMSAISHVGSILYLWQDQDSKVNLLLHQGRTRLLIPYAVLCHEVQRLAHASGGTEAYNQGGWPSFCPPAICRTFLYIEDDRRGQRWEGRDTGRKQIAMHL